MASTDERAGPDQALNQLLCGVVELDDPPGDSTDELVAGRIPNARGVVCFETDNGQTLLVGTSADMRRFVRARLAPPAGESVRGRVDLHHVTRRISFACAGSGFETDLAYLKLIRARLPTTYRSVTDRWIGWFVHCDPDAAHPRWTKVASSMLGAYGAPSGGKLIGPIADKHAAGRFIELLDDLFDLCRYHHLLVQSPDAMACAYKEMGKCPAPCDGSESLDSYRARVRDAIAFATTDWEAWQAACASEMRQAASAHDYEHAAHLRDQLERSKARAKPSLRLAGSIDEFRWLVVLPSERAGWLRLLLIIGGRAGAIADVQSGQTLAQASQDLARCIVRLSKEQAAAKLTGDDRDVIGLVSRRLYRMKQREGVFDRLPARRALDLEDTATWLLQLLEQGARQFLRQCPDDDGVSEEDQIIETC